ncbi:MAG TPA: ABC transporter ATP-binding protein [Terriglobales bacterium]|nr:ABC transporter ATP-binding protein [Terriglobales bacterium]
MNGLAVQFTDVVQRFRLIHERPDTLREFVAGLHQRPKRTTYHDFEAVKHVSFQISHGARVGIIGRNGSGKSTLLKIIAGVYKPSAGQVKVFGSIAPLIELGAGFHHELTGRENIVINGLLLGLSKRQIRGLEQQIIDFAEIGEFIDAPVKQYSSGMYMRVAFAVATAVDPDILLVDEILAVGDAGFRAKCFDRIASFHERGKTIILVSHDSGQIREFCDRVLLLHRGELIADTSPEEALARYDELTAHSHVLVAPGPVVPGT